MSREMMGVGILALLALFAGLGIAWRLYHSPQRSHARGRRGEVARYQSLQRQRDSVEEPVG